jgi:hypothetical protein
MIENGKFGTHLYAGIAALDLTVLPRWSQISVLDNAFDQRRTILMPIINMILESSRPQDGVKALVEEYANSGPGLVPLSSSVDAFVLLPLQSVSAEYGKVPPLDFMANHIPQGMIQKLKGQNKHHYTRGMFRHMYHMLKTKHHALSPKAHAFLYNITIKMADLLTSMLSTQGINVFREVERKYIEAKERTIADQPSEEFIKDADADDLMNWSELTLAVREARAAMAVLAMHPWIKTGNVAGGFLLGVDADIPEAFNLLGLRDSITDSFSGPFSKNIAPAQITTDGQYKITAYVFQTAVIHLKCAIDRLSLIIPKIISFRANLRNMAIYASEVELFFDRLIAFTNLVENCPEYQSCQFSPIYTHGAITSGGGFSSYWTKFKWKRVRYDLFYQPLLEQFVDYYDSGAPTYAIQEASGIRTVQLPGYDTDTIRLLADYTRGEAADWPFYHIRAAQVVDRAPASIGTQTPLQLQVAQNQQITDLIETLSQAYDNFSGRLDAPIEVPLTTDAQINSTIADTVSELQEYDIWSPDMYDDLAAISETESIVEMPAKEMASILKPLIGNLKLEFNASSSPDKLPTEEMGPMKSLEIGLPSTFRGMKGRSILFTTAPPDELGLIFSMPFPVDEQTWYRMVDLYETPTNRSYSPKPLEITTPHVGATMAQAVAGTIDKDTPYRQLAQHYVDNLIVLPMTPKALISVLEPKDVVWQHSVVLKETDAMGFRAVGTLLVPTDPLYYGTGLNIDHVITYFEHALTSQPQPPVPRSIPWYQ